MNGIGERSGNASLEEVALALKVLYGIDCGIDFAKTLAVSQLVEERSGITLQAHKAVVGRGAFAHESGMVVAGLLKEPFTAECYVPELVGQQRRIVLGKKSGLASVEQRLQQLGIAVDHDSAKQILLQVKNEALRTKHTVNDTRLRELAADVCKRERAASQ
jgi:isopropylmalate/homocitrate/citramalate synthase